MPSAGGDAALGGDGVRAGREDLGDAGGLQPLLGHAEGGAQARAAGADDHDVVGVVDEVVGCHRYLRQAKAMLATAKTPVSASAQQSSVLASSARDAQRLVVDVVLDDHLHALLQVPEADEQEEDRDDGVERLAVAARTASQSAPRFWASGKMKKSVSGTSAIEVRRWPHQWPAPSWAVPRPWTRWRSVR